MNLVDEHPRRAYSTTLVFQSIAYMTARRFTLVLEPAEEGGFVAKCIELPVSSQGETRKEALANIKEAIEGYLEVKAELFRDKPRERV